MGESKMLEEFTLIQRLLCPFTRQSGILDGFIVEVRREVGLGSFDIVNSVAYDFEGMLSVNACIH